MQVKKKKPAGGREGLPDTRLCVAPQQVRRDDPAGRDARAVGAVASCLHGADSALGTPARGAGLPPPLRLLRAQRSPLHLPLAALRARWDFSACGKNQSGVCITFLAAIFSLLASRRGRVSAFLYRTVSVFSCGGHRVLHDVAQIKRTFVTLLHGVLWG